MKTTITAYAFYFENGTITINHSDEQSAKILAQAEAIKRGWNYMTISDKPTKLKDYLLNKTQAMELCVITEDGWITATCYIDHEDMFHIPLQLAGKTVKSEQWSVINIVDKNGKVIQIPCHYIDV